MSHDLVARRTQGLAVAITGSGGSGAVTSGLILLAAVARAGYYGLMTRSAGPQIRGGESAAMIRFAPRPVRCMGDAFDLLVGLDWRNVARFVDEIPLGAGSVVLSDPSAGAVPAELLALGAEVREVPFKELIADVEGGHLNMAALGALGASLGLPLAALEEGALGTLGRKGRKVLDAALACLRAGYAAGPAGYHTPAPQAVPRWNISGNEASGLGAVRGGVRFVAAYPITPASEMLEWLAPNLERLGGALLQAEDELASVNMIIGSSFGGVPALTATSGPGLSLMMEGLGLAVASETPLVVANVMRGGPSTGIPTKSEQADLEIALYGFHGDAPHLVLAALDIRDCVFTFHWAVRLAEHLQTVAIVLTDQSLGQSRAIVDPPRTFEGELPRAIAAPAEAPYRRYALTDDGVSPMAIPGTDGCMYTADGLEHNPRGTPSSLAADHLAQLDKRRRKLADFDFGDDWAEIRDLPSPHGPAAGSRLCLVTWGSSTGVVGEAAERLAAEGRAVRVIALRLIAPLRRDALLAALEGAAQILVVEQNQGAQLFRYLHAERTLPRQARSIARPGPLPLRPGEIVAAVELEA
jgi:2-oxoglutarate ferredoxin oxidoreductase subunit alpha